MQFMMLTFAAPIRICLRQWVGSARARHRAAGHSCASITEKANKRPGPNAEPRGQSQMSSDARGSSSRDFTEDGRKAHVQIASAHWQRKWLLTCFP
jgi:hypothetical protein